jgi:phosphoenolpyruvate phosphomutase
VKVIVYANQLLRSAYRAMVKTATSILERGHSYESNARLMPIRDILDLVLS